MILPSLILLAQTLSGQPPAVATPMQRAIERVFRTPRVPAQARVILLEAPLPFAEAATCSVTLVEMAVSEHTVYTMKTVKPEASMAPMPTAQLPAPPCKSTR